MSANRRKYTPLSQAERERLYREQIEYQREMAAEEGLTMKEYLNKYGGIVPPELRDSLEQPPPPKVYTGQQFTSKDYIPSEEPNTHWVPVLREVRQPNGTIQPMIYYERAFMR